MKANKIIKASVILVALCISVAFIKPQEQKKMLMVKVVECPIGLVDSYIVTIDENSKTERIELGKNKLSDVSVNSIKVLEVLNKHTNNGYELAHTLSVQQNDVSIYTYLFQKN